SYVRRHLATQDPQDPEHYLCPPASAQEWLMLTDFSVERHWMRWKIRITQFPGRERFDDTHEHDGAWAAHKHPRRADDEKVWDALESDLFIGELRADGSVEPVRSQTKTSRGGDKLDCTPKLRHQPKGQITLNGGEQCLCPDNNIPAS